MTGAGVPLQRVHKYEVPPNGKLAATIEFPKGAVILDAQLQREKLCLWALVDPAAPLVARSVVTVGTGWDLPEHFGRTMQHVATFQDAGYVWHVFIGAEP